MASSSAAGGELAELKEDLKGLKEQKAAELKKEKELETMNYGVAEQGLGPSPGRDQSHVLR